MRRHWRRALRHRLYEILEHGPVGDQTGRVVSRLIVLLIVINLVAITLHTVPEFETSYAAWFLGIELLSLVVFTFEYGLRMWVAVEHALHSDGWKARLKYATSPIGVIDLFAVLPFWLAFVLPAELKILLVFRINPIPQAHPLLARHAVLARCPLCRAPGTVRLRGHLDRVDAGGCHRHACRRTSRSA